MGKFCAYWVKAINKLNLAQHQGAYLKDDHPAGCVVCTTVVHGVQACMESCTLYGPLSIN